MIDVPLIPTGGLGVPLPPITPVSRIVGTLTQALQNVPAGTTLTGVVTQRDANGNLTLSTPKGQMNLNTQLPLNTGSELGFKVLTNAPNLQVQLATIDGQSVTKELITDLMAGNQGDTRPSLNLTSSGADPTVFKAAKQAEPPVTPEMIATTAASETTIHAPYTGSFIRGTFITVEPTTIDNVIAEAVQSGIIGSSESVIPSPATNNDIKTATGYATKNTPHVPASGSSVIPGSTAIFRIVSGTIPQTIPATPQSAPITVQQPLPMPASLAMQPPPAAASVEVATAIVKSESLKEPNQLVPSTEIPAIVPSETQNETIPTTPVAIPVNGAPETAATVNNPVESAPVLPTTGTTAPPQQQTMIPEQAVITSTPQALPSLPLSQNPANSAASPLPYASQLQEAPNALQVTGTVIGTDTTGEAILKTPLGMVRLPAEASLPKGTELSLEIITINPAAVQQPLISSTTPLSKRDIIFQLFSQWSSLGDTVNTLEQQAPQLADKMLQTLIPGTNKQFTANLLNFINSVKTGNVEGWLGESIVKQLKDSGKSSTLQKLTQEFSAMKTLYTQPSHTNDWQTVIFPLYDGEDLHQVHMFVRDNPQRENNNSDDGNDRGKDTRFVVEVDTQMVGPMQFDGLVHSNPQKKNFDLIIRTQQPLPDTMRSDIAGIFQDASEITGMKGSLTFQATPDFPLRPIEDVLAEDRSSIMV